MVRGVTKLYAIIFLRMTVPVHSVRFTVAEFLSLERDSNIKHEFLDGQIYAMGGGSPEHAALAATVGGLLFAQLRGGPCRSYSSDLRVRTPSGLLTYADVAVICGPIERDTEDRLSATNPTLLVEVLSGATAEYDRRGKYEHYRTIASLQQYVLVSQDEQLIEVRTRDTPQWKIAIAREGEIADLASIGAHLAVNDVYA